MIKIGYISPVNPNTDRMAWSGTFYNTFHAIKNIDGIEVEWIPSAQPELLYKVLTKGVSLIYQMIYGKGSPTHSNLMAIVHKQFLDKKLLDRYNLLFIPGQSEIVAKLDCNTPIIYYSDATFKKMVGYYWFGFSDKAKKIGNSIEEHAIKNATYNFKCSNWAAKSTIVDYGANKNNTYVFPLGADVPQKIQGAMLPKYDKNELKLLFSGKDWKRKGGNVAVNAAEYLNKVGINCTLYIVGIKELPENIKNKQFIRLIGYINKNSTQDYQKYLDLYNKCNAFILPTRAECAGLVFSEANAFGMPIFTTDTGGIGDYVINGVNGYRLSLNATGTEFGKCIERAYNKRQFKALSDGSKKVYKNSTSWQAWSNHFKDFIERNFKNK